MKSFYSKLVAIPESKSYQLVKEEDILFCKSDGNYTNINFVDGHCTLVCKKIKCLEESLSTNIFIRVHNSFLVNIMHVKQFIVQDGCRVILDDGSSINVSRSRKKALMDRLITL